MQYITITLLQGVMLLFFVLLCKKTLICDEIKVTFAILWIQPPLRCGAVQCSASVARSIPAKWSCVKVKITCQQGPNEGRWGPPSSQHGSFISTAHSAQSDLPLAEMAEGLNVEKWKQDLACYRYVRLYVKTKWQCKWAGCCGFYLLLFFFSLTGLLRAVAKCLNTLWLHVRALWACSFTTCSMRRPSYCVALGCNLQSTSQPH